MFTIGLCVSSVKNKEFPLAPPENAYNVRFCVPQIVLSGVKIICAFSDIERRNINPKVRRFIIFYFFTNIRPKVACLQSMKIKSYSLKKKKS